MKLDPGNVDAANSMAVASFKLGDTKEAEQLLASMRQTGPADVRTAVNRALMRLHSADLPGAVALIEQASASVPASVDLSLLLARLYGAQQQHQLALRELERITRQPSANALAWATLASLYASLNRPLDALPAYRQAARLEPSGYAHFPALFLWNTGQRPTATAELKQLFEAHPKDYVARRRYRNALLQTGNQAEADKILKEAFERNPKDSEALVGHCHALILQGRWESAISTLRQVITDDAANFLAHYLLARIYHVRRQPTLERQELDEALRLNPSFLTARLELSRSQVAAGRHQAALAVLESAPPMQKQTAAWLEAANWAYLAAGNGTTAERGIDQLLKLAPSPDALLQKAFAQMARKQFPAAQETLRRALALKPDFVAAFDTLGNTYAYEKQLSKGLSVLKQFAEANPQSIPIQFAYSVWLSRTGQIPEAEEVLRKAQKLAPQDPSISIRLGELALASSRVDQARAHLSAAIKLNPATPRGQLLMANVESLAGNKDLAMAGYRYVIELQADNHEALNNLAALQSEDNSALDEALNLAQRAKELSPSNPNYSDTLGWILYRKGLFKEAVPVLEAAQSSTNPIVGFHLAMAYSRVGDHERAKIQFARASRTGARLPEAAQARQVIDSKLSSSTRSTEIQEPSK